MKYISKELYPDDDRWFSDYQPIIDYLGYVLLQVDDGNYQGDSRILYFSEGKFGYLQFGWGSCSGCDQLQACDNYADVDKLILELKKAIRWFKDKEECQRYFETHDWEGDYSWNSEEQREFIERTKKILNAIVFT